MKILSNLKVQNGCKSCDLRSESFFCNLPEPTFQVFESLKINNIYPKGATLFFEGQPAKGIYLLCQGSVKLSTCSRDGRAIILHIAEVGEILGLSAVVTDSPYEVTAQVLEHCHVSFVRKADFMTFLQQNNDVCFNAAKQLSQMFQTAYAQVQSLGLSSTVTERLAKLLLKWCKKSSKEKRNIHLSVAFTQEEIAEMIGTSRETVSRLLKDFRNKKLITVCGSDFIVHDRQRLESLIDLR